MEHSAELRIYLFGVFRVVVGGREIDETAWRRRKAAHLVKLLALAPGHRLHRDQILDQLWPEMDPAEAANNFHRTVHEARRVLEPSESLASPRRYLQRRGDALLLDATGQLWTDLDAFHRAARAARGAGEPTGYQRALALYTGELLPEDRYEDWAIAQREEAQQWASGIPGPDPATINNFYGLRIDATDGAGSFAATTTWEVIAG